MFVTPVGPIMQAAFIVDDLEAAARRWAQALGVGPFFVLDRVTYEASEYEGAPADLEISVAFAYSGDLQIELIQQYSTGPSIYNANGASRTGLHHFGIVTTDMAKDEAALIEAGFRKVQWARSAGGGGVAYFEGPAPCVIELIELSEGGPGFFAHLKQSALAWDRQSVFLNK